MLIISRTTKKNFSIFVLTFVRMPWGRKKNWRHRKKPKTEWGGENGENRDDKIRGKKGGEMKIASAKKGHEGG
jgi:hypothetical protein